jgi:WS/DGAT/MGAT family acyltransferase
VVRGVLDQAVGDAKLVRVPLRVAASPMRALGVASQSRRIMRATADLLRPARPVGLLNAPISPLRHLARARRPLGDLQQIKTSFGTTVNDVVLAVSASGVRRLFEQRGELPLPLKTMVPVNVRRPEQDGSSGNRISFMFVDLPCDEPDPVRRLQWIHTQTRERKGDGEPEGMDGALEAVGYLPQPVRDAVSHALSSPLVFNLTVSNIPGPAEPMFMLGCELEEAYPVVPIPDGHALSIGVTTIRDQAFFGLYADRELLDADLLAGAIDESVEELFELS